MSVFRLGWLELCAGASGILVFLTEQSSAVACEKTWRGLWCRSWLAADIVASGNWAWAKSKLGYMGMMCAVTMHSIIWLRK